LIPFSGCAMLEYVRYLLAGGGEQGRPAPSALQTTLDHTTISNSLCKRAVKSWQLLLLQLPDANACILCPTFQCSSHRGAAETEGIRAMCQQYIGRYQCCGFKWSAFYCAAFAEAPGTEVLFHGRLHTAGQSRSPHAFTRHAGRRNPGQEKGDRTSQRHAIHQLIALVRLTKPIFSQIVAEVLHPSFLCVFQVKHAYILLSTMNVTSPTLSTRAIFCQPPRAMKTGSTACRCENLASAASRGWICVDCHLWDVFSFF
jgi:hypothetical protein